MEDNDDHADLIGAMLSVLLDLYLPDSQGLPTVTRFFPPQASSLPLAIVTAVWGRPVLGSRV